MVAGHEGIPQSRALWRGERSMLRPYKGESEHGLRLSIVLASADVFVFSVTSVIFSRGSLLGLCLFLSLLAVNSQERV